VKEPDGFDRPSGVSDLQRHKNWGILNPGIATFKIETDLKVNKYYNSFLLGFAYSCKACGKAGSQTHQTLKLKVNYPAIPSFPIPTSTHY
jgi:hypothetical protein